MFLAFYFRKLSSQKVMFGIGMAYGILMAISQIRIGAYFTSDVIMSLFIMFLFMTFADFMINKVTANIESLMNHNQ